MEKLKTSSLPFPVKIISGVTSKGILSFSSGKSSNELQRTPPVRFNMAAISERNSFESGSG